MSHPTALNDRSIYFRRVCGVLGAGLGVFWSGVVVSSAADDSTVDRWIGVVPIMLGLGVNMGVSVAVTVLALRWDRRLRSDLEASGRDVVSDAVGWNAVAGRVVRSGSVRGRTAGVIERGRPPALVQAGTMLILTALPLGAEARRVAVLAPATVPRPAVRRGTTHLVHLDPRRSEAAVLDVTGDPGAIRGAAQDPRWTTATLPTTGSVVGGWGRAALAWLGGLVVGTLLGVGLVLLLRAV